MQPHIQVELYDFLYQGVPQTPTCLMKTKVFRKKPSMIFRNPDVPCCFFQKLNSWAEVVVDGPSPARVPVVSWCFHWTFGAGKSPAKGHENVHPNAPRSWDENNWMSPVEDQSGAFNQEWRHLVEIMFERPDIYRISNEETIYMCHVKLGSGTGHIAICRTCSLSILFFVGILFFFGSSQWTNWQLPDIMTLASWRGLSTISCHWCFVRFIFLNYFLSIFRSFCGVSSLVELLLLLFCFFFFGVSYSNGFSQLMHRIFLVESLYGRFPRSHKIAKSKPTSRVTWDLPGEENLQTPWLCFAVTWLFRLQLVWAFSDHRTLNDPKS